MNDLALRRGEVWLADLDKVSPVVVVSRDPMGRLLNTEIAAHITSSAICAAISIATRCD